MSRPEKPIDWQHVDEALAAGCFGTEIAEFFHMHPNTFYDRVAKEFGMGFTEYSCLKKEVGNALLKLTQFKKAIGTSDKGDNSMLIWLGKNRLGQREAEIKTVTDDEIKRLDAFMGQLKTLQESQSASKIETKTNSNE